MQEALRATKILAEDCRLKGTAFRLGVCFYANNNVKGTYMINGCVS